MSDQSSRRWRSAIALAALLALTLAVRVGVLVAMQDNLRQDPDAYRNIASNLVWHGVYGMGHDIDKPPQPTAYRPPLYPLVLAKFASDDGGVVLWRVAVLHVVLGLATVALVWVVAGQMLECGPLAPRVDGHSRSECTTFLFAAGLMVACDPLLLNQSTLVMTETLAAFLTVLCLYALNRFAADRRPWNAGLAGGAIALAILCRPTYLPWLALVGLAMLLMRTSPKSKVQSPKSGAEPGRLSNWLWRGLNVATLGLIAAVVVSPWAIRNYRVFGKPIVSTTHGGYTLHLANNRSFYDYLRKDESGEPWDSKEFDGSVEFDPLSEVTLAKANREGAFRWATSENYRVLEELETDAVRYERALTAIEFTTQDEPLLFVYSCLYRLRQLWSPLPHRLTADEALARTAMRYAVAAWYVAVYLLAAVGIWKLRGRLLAPPWLWGVLLCLVFTGIHTFYWTNLRMRAPLMPFVALVAAYGLCELRRRVGQARSASAVPPGSTSR